MQVQFIQKSEPHSTERKQNAPGPQEVKGESFRTVLAKEEKIEKELHESRKEEARKEDSKKNASVKKKDPQQKQTSAKHAVHQSGKKLHKKKKLLSDPSKIKTDLQKLHKRELDKKVLDAQKQKPGKKKKLLPVDIKENGRRKKIEKKQVHAHTSGIDTVAALLSTGSIKDGKASVVKTNTKTIKDKKETGVKKSSGVLTVIDLRSKKHTDVKDTLKKVKDRHHKTDKTDTVFKNIKHDKDQEPIVKLVTTHQTDKSNVPDVPRTPAPTEAKAVLLKELQDKMNDRIVKESGIVLKDNNSGEIKLILKPESLGKVRIRLHLQDNHLTGKILVTTTQAQDAFEKNMQNLVKAFNDRGFSMASLDVSVGGKGRDQEQKEERNISNRILGVIESSVPVAGNYKYSDNIIDLVV